MARFVLEVRRMDLRQNWRLARRPSTSRGRMPLPASRWVPRFVWLTVVGLTGCTELPPAHDGDPGGEHAVRPAASTAPREQEARAVREVGGTALADHEEARQALKEAGAKDHVNDAGPRRALTEPVAKWLPPQTAERTRAACDGAFTPIVWNQRSHSGGGRAQSPFEANLALELTYLDDTSFEMVLKTPDSSVTLPEYAQTNAVYWSADSEMLALVDEDMYASSGARGIVVVDIRTGKHRSIELSWIELAADSGNKPKPGQHHRVVEGLCWLPEHRGLVMSLSAGYSCDSGHPGINAQRQDYVGDKFCDPARTQLGTFLVAIPDRLR